MKEQADPAPHKVIQREGKHESLPLAMTGLTSGVYSLEVRRKSDLKIILFHPFLQINTDLVHGDGFREYGELVIGSREALKNGAP